MGFFPTTSLINKGMSLPTLPKCGACGLYKDCHSPKMKPTGRGTRKILFIGEAPGENEDKQGKQFIGDAGKCLRRMLDDLDFEMDDCRITNAVICRPPKNEIDDAYIEYCRPNALNTIKEFKPNVIIPLGKSAINSLLSIEWREQMGEVGKWVGWQIPSKLHNAWVCPTYHPSYVIRTNEDPALVKIVKRHLRAAIALENQPVIYLDKDSLIKQVEILTKPSDVITRLCALAKAKGRLAFDYETTGLKPERPEQHIFSVSFCLNGKDTFAFKMRGEYSEHLSAVLLSENLDKIAANLKFEERWTFCKLKHRVANWKFDTMLGAHLLDNRGGATGLKFQAYVQFGLPDYSTHLDYFKEAKTANGLNRIHEAPLADILLYNGMDSLLEYMLAERQTQQLMW